MNFSWQDISVILMAAAAATYLVDFYFYKKKKFVCAYADCECKPRKGSLKK